MTLTALPVTPASLPVADRDVVRDPYTSLFGLLAQGSISAQSIAPAVTSHFFVPPMVFGGGFSPIALGAGGGFPSFVAPRLPVVFAPWVGSSFSSLNQNGTQRNVTIGVTSVPDAGATIALFAAALSGLFVFGRRYFRR